MLLKSAAQARAYGDQIADTLSREGPAQACLQLNDILCERTPFRLLDLVGAALDRVDRQRVDALLDCIAAQGSQGGWVVIASALRERLPDNLAGALHASQTYLIQADIWYGCDILGERVPGPALVDTFLPTLEQLEDWRVHPNRWVRRALGVAVHFWAKRTHGSRQNDPLAIKLLSFLSPLLEERNIDAAKGIGWGLKTIGRYYPAVACDWLEEELLMRQRKPLSVVKRKALLYLPPELKRKFQR